MDENEEMAYAMYLADCEYDLIGTPGSSVRPYKWEELHEEIQQEYVRHAKAALKYLSEKNRLTTNATKEA